MHTRSVFESLNPRLNDDLSIVPLMGVNFNYLFTDPANQKMDNGACNIKAVVSPI